MPTGADEEPPAQDGLAESDTSAVPAAGFESFLSAVRGMVHGDDEGVLPVEPAPPGIAAPSGLNRFETDPVDRQPTEWLPGTWVVDEPPPRRGRRSSRAAVDPIAKQERKLLEAERRNARKRDRRSQGSPAPVSTDAAPFADVASDPARRVSRIPLQSERSADEQDADPGERARVSSRRQRRTQRRDAARDLAVPDRTDDEAVAAELVESVSSTRTRSRGSRRVRRRDRGRSSDVVAESSGYRDAVSAESDAASGSMSETGSMSQLDSGSAESTATRRTKRKRRVDDAHGATPPVSAAPADLPEPASKVDHEVPSVGQPPDDADVPDEPEVRALDNPVPVELPLTRRERRREDRERRRNDEAARQAVRAQEREAREAAEAEAAAQELERRATEQAARAAETAAANDAARRSRLEAEVARLEARTSATAEKHERRLGRQAARADAKATAEAAKVEHRQDVRARRLAKRRARADATAAAEAAKVERRQQSRARRLEERTDRVEAKLRADAEMLERKREVIEQATSVRPTEPRPSEVSGPASEAAAPDVPVGRARRRERRLEAARALAEAVPTVAPASDPAADVVDEPAARSGRERRREQRRAASLANEVARAADGVQPSDDPVHEDETLAEYLARVEASILPRRTRRTRSRVPVRVRRAAKITAACVLIGGAAVLPWAAPEIPGLIADAVPGNDSPAARVEDPPVAPRTNAIAGPVGIPEERSPYDGVRLASAGWPRQVQVPRLHVDSEVVPISGQSGSLLPPSDPQILGWWREGQPVGAQYGSAVVTGHTVHTGGGALDNLDKLAVGDSLRVRTDDGWITYVVQRTRIYSTAQLARDAEDIFRLGGTGRLVVITCDDFNGVFYESNAVVFAAPVADDPFVGEGVGDVPDPGPGSTS